MQFVLHEEYDYSRFLPRLRLFVISILMIVDTELFGFQISGSDLREVRRMNSENFKTSTDSNAATVGTRHTTLAQLDQSLSFETQENGTSQICSTFKTYDFILAGCIVGALCIFGIIGNVVAFVVFTMRRHRSVAMLLLRVLAVADSLYLLTHFISKCWYQFAIYFGKNNLLIHCSRICMSGKRNAMKSINTVPVW